MRDTMKRVYALNAAGKLPPTFNAALLNELLGIHWAGKFLPKYRDGNPGYETVHFVRVSRKSTRQRATDQEILKWISRQHGFVPLFG